MRSPKSFGRLSCLLAACFILVGPACSSSESLPAIKPSQAKEFSKRFAKVVYKRIAECLAEKAGEEIPDMPEMDEEVEKMYAESLEKALKGCERWDQDLAEACLDEMPKAECDESGSAQAGSCDALLGNCGQDFQDVGA